MKVSTTLSFQRSLDTMQETRAQVSQTREQLASGKAVVRPSDDTMKVASIENLDRAITKQETYLGMMTQLMHRYQLEETALTNGSDLLVRIKELAIQGANATLSAKDREIIAVEVQGLRDELLSIANTRDEHGNAVFAGGNSEVTAFQTQADGSVAYKGDARQTMVSVSDARQLGKNRNGLDVFASADRNVPGSPATFTVSVADLTQFNDGTTRCRDHGGTGALLDTQDLLTDNGHEDYDKFAYAASLSHAGQARKACLTIGEPGHWKIKALKRRSRSMPIHVFGEYVVHEQAAITRFNQEQVNVLLRSAVESV